MQLRSVLAAVLLAGCYGGFDANSDEVDSIELVVAYAPGEGRAMEPIGAQAITRNRSGNVVYGAPVQWSVERGDLRIEAGGRDPRGLEYALITDECVPPRAGSATGLPLC